MKRRSFLGAMLGAVLPLPPMPLKATIPSGFIFVSDYPMTFDFGDDPQGVVLYRGEIGSYEGFRFITSKEIR